MASDPERRLRVGILHEEMHRPARRFDGAVLDSVLATERVLSGMGHSVTLLPIRSETIDWIERLRAARLDLIFNLCEGLDGEGMGEFLVTAAAELLDIPITGCSADVLAFALRKDRVNAWLAQIGLPIPAFAVAERGAPLPDWDRYPAIVKPAGEDGSLGIYERAVVRDRAELELAVAELVPDFDPLLIQEYVAGREFNAAFVGQHRFPLAEIDFSGMPEDLPKIVSYAAKWESGSPADNGSVPVCPAPVARQVEIRIMEVAEAAWLAVTGGRGYGRVDVRLDAGGTPYVIEVNPNPDFTPRAGLARMAGVAGWSYDDLVATVCNVALGSDTNGDARSRDVQTREAGNGAVAPAPALGASESEAGATDSNGPVDEVFEPRRSRDVTVGEVTASHREAVRAILEGTEVFRYDEVLVGLEVLDIHLNQPEQTDYFFVGAFDGEANLVGYACYGPTPCTLGTWDLYWIAVDPEWQAGGVGSRLLDEVEREVWSRHGRMILAETSSQPGYDGTRAFYARRGYDAVSRVEDFYAPGDDRVIFAKRSSGGGGGSGFDG
jgi:D-alanine-D-alanine ligase